MAALSYTNYLIKRGKFPKCGISNTCGINIFQIRHKGSLLLFYGSLIGLNTVSGEEKMAGTGREAHQTAPGRDERRSGEREAAGGQ